MTSNIMPQQRPVEDTVAFSSYPLPPGSCIPSFFSNKVDCGRDLQTLRFLYVLARGTRPGVYTRWEDCSSMCQKGIPHRRWRKRLSAYHSSSTPPAPQISPKKPYTTVAPPATTSTPNKHRRFFAVSSPNKGDVVFTNREEAQAALLEAEGHGEEARLIYSTSLDEVEDMLDSMSLRSGQ
ncbi:hypothetical protein C8J56DRAFT_1063741 [Mycena floridula]|nr:hypothetical protein C8J56DRAFT_1063741 [Mycena floridula]